MHASSRHLLRVVAACALLICGVAASPVAMADYASECDSCHAALVPQSTFLADGGRRNAAGSVSVIQRSISVVPSMNGLPTQNLASIAAEIAAAIGPTTQTETVAYGSNGNSITINKILIAGSAVIDRLVRVSGPASISIPIGSETLSYDHTAGNCSVQTLVVRGQNGPSPSATQTSDRTVAITVTPPPPPNALDASFSIAHNTAPTTLDVGPFVSGTAPAASMTIGALGPNVGSSVATGPQTFTYAASASAYAPVVTTTYSVTGPCATGSVTRNVTINVRPPPAPSVVAPPPQSVSAQSPTTIDLNAQITGIQDTTPAAPAGTYVLMASQPTAPSSGTTSVAGNKVTYTPPGNFTGQTTFTFTRSGPGGTSNVATVTLNVSTAPIVTGTSVTTAFNTPITVNLAAFITGPFTSVTPSAAVGGTAVATGPASIKFTPDSNFTGAASFAYTATGPSGTSPPATVSVTVNPPPPVISSPDTASGAAGQPFTYQITASNSPTSFGVTGALPAGLGVSASGLISGMPTQSGAFPVTVTAANAGGQGSQRLTINIALPSPVITSPAAVTGAMGVPFSYQITANNNPTRYAATGLPPGLGVNTSTGLISGTPTAGGIFKAEVSATGATETVALEVTFTIALVAPVAQDLTIEVQFGAPTPIALPVSGQFTQVAIVTAPSHGTAATPAPGSATVVYTPSGNYSGADSFTYNAAGPGGTSQTAQVNITVPLGAPVAQAVALTVPLNTPTTIDLLAFISGSGLTGVAIAADASHGITEVNGTRVTYSPKQNYFGSDSFSYYAFGTVGTSPPAVVTVTVTGRPDPAKDANVVGLIGAQSEVARRFARAQISNIQRRMESLHVDPPDSDAAAPAAGRGTAPPPASLANSIVSMAQSGTVNLANSTERGDAAAGMAKGLGVWIGGTASFGTRDSTEESAGARFRTDGVTVGGDWRTSDRLALGMGVGYARDKTHFGDDGTQMKSDGASIAAYASYQPSRSTFVDALLGYGTLSFDTDRYVSSADDFATAGRKGRQVFGSIAGGFEYRKDGVLLSPYGRLDFTFDKLKQEAETGAGSNALTYLDQTQRTVQFSLGMRAESQHATNFGVVRPRVRAEYRHDFEGGGDATITYADQFAGLSYSVAPTGTKSNFLLLGVGGDFVFRNGPRLGLDYQWQSAGGADSGQTVRLLLSQDLDGKGWSSAPWSSRPLADAVRAEAGFTYDDNVTRGRAADEILSDRIYSLNLATGRDFPIDANSRVVVTGLLNGEMYHRYTGLAHLSGGVQAEAQYRGSADFDAVTLAAFARGWLDGYQSQLRDGGRYAVGVSARRALTDRIDVYGELSGNWRRARSAVWDLSDFGARLNFDYSLGRSGALYLNGEFHRGDTVSDGVASLVNVSLAEVFVLDDAFPGDRLFAYRFDARTWVGTLGYNFPLGPRDSIDFSWRRVQSTPTAKPAYESPGSLRYVDNQYSIVYLIRF